MNKSEATSEIARLEAVVGQCDKLLEMMALSKTIDPELVAKVEATKGAVSTNRDALLGYLRAIESGSPLAGFDEYLQEAARARKSAARTLLRVNAQIRTSSPKGDR